MSMKRTVTREAWAFFRDHCGCVGRQAIAGLALARAEVEARALGWYVSWEPEEEPYEMGDAETRMPDEVYCAVLRDEGGRVLGSLGMIGDPDALYRRIVEAELADEALSERRWPMLAPSEHEVDCECPTCEAPDCLACGRPMREHECPRPRSS